MPASESGPWEFHPCASAQLFREVSLSCPAVVALPVAIRHLRPVVVARINWSWRTASRLGWRRMYQMNEYELVKVHGEGQYPFTYRGENGVLLGCFGKDTCFSLIFHKSRIEKLATITFLSRCSYSPLTYLFMLPYPNVVPATESHRSVASLLSSQSRIPFSGRYALVKLHGFTPPIFILSIRDKTKAP